ncbi:TrmH family RNA methyltransferase [Jiangella alkaliphila]|uniref:SpoU rRNA Methylase family protein n=1 Tax=Jiangella alkaliphila TaxID=419479 RepID=A0A1H2ITC2_9ACTN|nr:TrmH family RNA methyltransferase [Jiangella alkaliphila]SDU47389.1 SpoU rRNA Methylase family protein [Jiangella alkaliphila]
MSGAKTKPRELRAQRRQSRHGCWDHLIIAPLWVAYDANLGTLLRTCDAIGACLAAPRTRHYRDALQIGDTLRGRRPCVHWVAPSKEAWLDEQRAAGKRIVAVELADGATSLARLAPAREPTVLLLGHEHNGVPDEVLAGVDECVEIPMIGWGASLNVAVAASLVAYRLAGLS